jgi:hypothetical protein
VPIQLTHTKSVPARKQANTTVCLSARTAHLTVTILRLGYVGLPAGLATV